MREKTTHVLLVEDNPADARLAEEALREGQLDIHLSVVPDGAEALDFLYKRGVYAHVSIPDLVLLDLNLPRKSGAEVLADIKAAPELRRVPVIVLSSSRASEDILRSYDLHANCYISKPLELDSFIDIIRQINGYWFGVAALPSQ